MKKCYDKTLEYVVPRLYCSMCEKNIRPGDGLYMVVLKWGDGRHTCEECYNKYEIDWSMREIEREDDEL